MKKCFQILTVIILLFVFGINSKGQTQTMGLFLNTSESYNGYTLFAPLTFTDTYLIDNCGKLVHSWSSSYKPGNAVYLLDNGLLLRTGNTTNQAFQGAGGAGGIIEMLDKSSNVNWSYEISTNNELQHHDVEYLPNGNILAIVWEKIDESSAINQGRDPSTIVDELWSEKIVEINPTNNTIEWQWRVWDHLVQDYDNTLPNFGEVADNPQLININYIGGQGGEDWLHINSVDYNPELDQILLSVHNFSEIWIIDHSTSTTEAEESKGGNANQGGDLLFRWGNPQAYDVGNESDRIFFMQHDARWIETDYPDEGKIMVFNNGLNRPEGNYSSIDIITPEMEGYNYIMNDNVFLPENLYWQYTDASPTSFFSQSISGSEQLPNGNVLICEGASGHFFEINAQKEIVWEYINPVSINGPLEQGTEIISGPGGTPNPVFRVKRISTDFVGLENIELNPGNPIEINPIDYDCEIFTSINNVVPNSSLKIYPNPTNSYIRIENQDIKGEVSITIFNTTGQVVKQTSLVFEKNIILGVDKLESGLYHIHIHSNEMEFGTSFVKE
jgi:hypothetical protein